MEKMEFLIPPHSLTNFDIQKYYQNEPKFNGLYSRNDLTKKIKDGAYVINLDNIQIKAYIGLLYLVTEVK